ncbi:MAG TPA: DUF2341 domain-containing protein [Methanocella sp.]|nr:DUF2341 domain-containing protein [Methanocella sp.]
MRFTSFMVYGIVALLILLSLAVSVYAADGSSTNTSGYSYTKSHKIAGSQDGDLFDYQMKYIIHRDTGTDNGQDVYLGGHSLSWPNDIRFENAAGDSLSYWVESSDSNSATIWVKIDKIPTSGTTITAEGLDMPGSNGLGVSAIFTRRDRQAEGQETVNFLVHAIFISLNV